MFESGRPDAAPGPRALGSPVALDVIRPSGTVLGPEDLREDALIDALDAAHRDACAAQRHMLALIAEADGRDSWQDSGARDMAHWVSIRYGISWWKARRWIVAARALEGLPRVSEALATSELSLDKTVELARFASPETETHLVGWAKDVSCGAIRHRAEVWASAEREEVVDNERSRRLEWWWFGKERRFGLSAELPAAQGAIIRKALERMTEQVPAMPGEEDYVEARRADALVALCSARLAADPDPDRATVVVHARLEGLEAGSGGCELEDGASIAPDTARRLLCNARVQTVVEDAAGHVIGLGRVSREPSAWMVRQVRYRDRECRFPSCGSRRFTEAHHVRWWRHGGRTDLDNLLLICSFHHRLVHEHGWSVKRDLDGSIHWFDAGGIRYRAGPSPPRLRPAELTQAAADRSFATHGSPVR